MHFALYILHSINGKSLELTGYETKTKGIRGEKEDEDNDDNQKRKEVEGTVRRLSEWTIM